MRSFNKVLKKAQTHDITRLDMLRRRRQQLLEDVSAVRVHSDTLDLTADGIDYTQLIANVFHIKDPLYEKVAEAISRQRQSAVENSINKKIKLWALE